MEGEILDRFELAPRRHAELILSMIDQLLVDADIRAVDYGDTIRVRPVYLAGIDDRPLGLDALPCGFIDPFASERPFA